MADETLDPAKVDRVLQEVWVAAERYAALLSGASGSPRPTRTERLLAAEAIRDYAVSLVEARQLRSE